MSTSIKYIVQLYYQIDLRGGSIHTWRGVPGDQVEYYC